MNAISKRSANSTKCKIPAAGADLPPVLPERQSVMAVRKRRLPDIVVPLPQVAAGEHIDVSILRAAPKAC
jgi:hypothetical protein